MQLHLVVTSALLSMRFPEFPIYFPTHFYPQVVLVFEPNFLNQVFVDFEDSVLYFVNLTLCYSPSFEGFQFLFLNSNFLLAILHG